MRLFLGCSPRTGNVWFRKMLAASIGSVDLCGHSPDEIAWSNLPLDCILAMHWHHSHAFGEYLRSQAFTPIVMIRHPLDILISILHFSQFEPATRNWLNGEGGSETILTGVDPTSPEFLEYGLSERAAALLAVSAEWLGHAKAVIQYEKLVDEPESVLHSVLDRIGCSLRQPIGDVVYSHSLARLKQIHEHHFWLGQPGLWRRVLTKEFRERMTYRHRTVFELLGYDCQSLSSPSREEAQSVWMGLCKSDPIRTSVPGIVLSGTANK